MASRTNSAKKRLDFDQLREYRESTGENQTKFWKRFAVSQSTGSRYEAGERVPGPVRILMMAHAEGLLAEETLSRLRERAAASA